MPRTIYFDCFGGAAGDMLLGALLDAGADLEQVRRGLESLPIQGWKLEPAPLNSKGISGTHARVLLEADVPQPHRGLADVERVVRSGSLPLVVVDEACEVFRRLAETEAKIHGSTPDEVHFHEVGAVDAIVDVVGVVLALHLLGVESGDRFSSGLPLGSGWVKSLHGPLPIPAPATAELLRQAGAPTRKTPATIDGKELTTPTAAALLTTLTTFEEPAFDAVQQVGYGFGTREMPWPNAVRVIVGARRATGGLIRETILQLETHLDDSTPEQLGFAMERLLEIGALDVAFVPLQMKKNRPGILLRVLGRPADADLLAQTVLRHTTALGVRVQPVERLIARRAERVVTTPWGSVRVKDKLLGAERIASPEYEDCAAAARAAGVPLAQVYAAARAAAESTDQA